MLARTASDLFWLARYMERADYVARLLQIAGKMSAVRVDGQVDSEWQSALVAAGVFPAFRESGLVLDEANATHYLAFSRENPSSIASWLETARRNARSVRTALTAEMWEAVNTSWQELAGFEKAPLAPDQLGAFLEWTKARIGLFHGVCSNAMLRLDGFHFVRVGQFLERADNTARLLDVKYHVRSGSELLDFYQWMAILQGLGARRAFRVMFKTDVSPVHIADLLLARREFPRSLAFCLKQITEHLDAIEKHNSARVASCKQVAHSLYAQLRFARAQEIVDAGMHEYLTDVIQRCDILGREIGKGHYF